jgi:hypothetical protein
MRAEVRNSPLMQMPAANEARGHGRLGVKEETEHQHDQHRHEQRGHGAPQALRQRAEHIDGVGAAVDREQAIERHQQIAQIDTRRRNPRLAPHQADKGKAADEGGAIENDELAVEDQAHGLLRQSLADRRAGHISAYGTYVRHSVCSLLSVPTDRTAVGHS